VNIVSEISRRGFLKSGGALVVSFTIGARLDALVQGGPAQGGPPPGGRGGPDAPATAAELDSFLAIHEDGSVTLSTSRVDVGTGIATAFCQTAAEELGIPVDRFTVIEGDTARTPNHGGTGGSSGIPRGAADIRRAAATARQTLIEMGAVALNRPAAELTIVNGDVRPASGGAGRSVGSLMGGKRFSIRVNPNVPLKDPSTYTVVGKPILRPDVAAKSIGRHVYVQDHRVDAMLHARVIRPAAVGAKLASVEESSIGHIPDARVVRLESFLAVVAKNEWAAIRGARELKTSWSGGQTLPGSDGLDRYLRSAALDPTQPAINRGDATAALSSAARQVTATYYWPFQSHGSLGPSCAVADMKADGVTIWSATQDAYGLRNALARTFALQPNAIRIIYMDGSGSYGTNGAWDVAADALMLSRAVGQPVRVQWMRQDELGWDPKGPAQLLDLRGGLDTAGNLIAWETHAYGPGGPQWTRALLAQDSAGLAAAVDARPSPPVTQHADPPYNVANLRVVAYPVPDTPLRLSNLRSPGKIANVFAVESFTDELAAAAGVDPLAFRRHGLSDPRGLAVLDRAAQMIGWQPRPSPSPAGRSGNVGVGRGIAYVHYKQVENYVAVAMEVAVDRTTGRITIRRVTCAHECGLIVNPDGLRNQVEGNIMHTLSRTLHEEVTFDRSKVTSVDWASYPVRRFPEAPPIEVALLDRPDQPPFGAGEAASTPVAAALANAVFDATGVRLRTVPFTIERVKAAIAAG
jgi:nicotinate dehydrogenase subunit B